MISYEELLSLFKSNPDEAIEKSQELICSVTGFNTFSDFFTYHHKHPHVSTCQREWSKRQMAIQCSECSNTPQSCLCLQCFLNGDHKGHHYSISPNSCGNCDCGDLSLWKRSGFCKDHHGVEENSHPEDYLKPELRTILTDVIFKAAFNALLALNTDENAKYEHILQFISSFLQFGDGFRRLVTITFTEKVGAKTIFESVFTGSEKYNQTLKKLCGCLLNDDFFRCGIAPIVYDLVLDRVLPDVFSFQTDKTNYRAWNSFWFHLFMGKSIEYSITEYGWDWVFFTLKFTILMKNSFALIGKVSKSYEQPNIIQEIVINIPRASRVQTSEQIQRFFDDLFTNVLNSGSNVDHNDNIVVASFSDKHQENYYKPVYNFKVTYYLLINCFKLKKNLKLDKLFDELDRLTDISPIYCIGRNDVGGTTDNENDNFVSKFLKSSADQSLDINDKYFKSFHNGGSLLYSFPLYDSLPFIFGTDNMNRVKVARILSMGKFQSLRIKLGIITLKNILSFVCLHQSLTANKNHSLKYYMKSLLRDNYLSLSVPHYLPLFQLLLGLQCNEANITNELSMKEFFAFEMAREVGLFDNYESVEYSDEEIDPLKKQMSFSVLYMAILIVIERNLFNFSSSNFIEEQIILALKSGISKLGELNKSFDDCYESSFIMIFNEVISKVATTNSNSEKKDSKDTKESSFFLKNDVKWKTVTAMNLFNKQKVILEKEISKNPDQLLQIPDFEPEESFFFQQPREYKANNNKDSINEYDIDSTGLNIKLKEFLFTPTILAVAYQVLRSSSEDAIQNVALNDHLAMMILVLVNRFASEIEAKNLPPFDESTVIQYDSSLIDLISKLKKTVFGFSNNQIEDSATIKNTLDSKSFHTFLNVKIGSPGRSPKSFIDLLLEKKEIGKNVLIQMSVDISKYGYNDESTNMKQEQINKKKRAKNLKAKIMSEFTNMASNFNFTDIDQIEESRSLSNDIGNVCSICSTAKKKQILSYPIYIYRTKIPFAFDKPPMVIYNPQCEVPVDDDLNDLIFNDEELQQMENENYNDDNNDEDQDNDNDHDIGGMMENLDTFENQEEMRIYLLLFRAIMDSRKKKQKRSDEKRVKMQYMRKMRAYKEEMLNSEAYKRGRSDTERMVTAGSNFVLQFGICQHLVHPECVNKESFNCPIDRSRRNGFLPSIDGIWKENIFKDFDSCHDVRADTLTDEMQETLSNFMNIYSSFFKDSDIFIELIKSISGLIATYEIRLRSLPDCLDSENTNILSRNLFLTTWYLYRMCEKPKICLHGNGQNNVDERLTTFQKFIKKLIECDSLVNAEDNSNYTKQANEDFMRIVRSFVSSSDFPASVDPLTKEKMIYLFLKRACLADHFLLNNENNSQKSEFSNIIDWDEILSVSSLSERFCVKLDGLKTQKETEFEFKPFVFCNMPKEFLHFSLKPYDFNVEGTNKISLFNFIDYNFLIRKHDDFNDVIIDEEEEMEKNQRNIVTPQQVIIQSFLTTNYSRCVYPSVFLSIGTLASKVFIVNDQAMGDLNPFYLDRFGCEDVGYKRGMPLFLNEEKYERVIDKILSGDFSFYFRS